MRKTKLLTQKQLEKIIPYYTLWTDKQITQDEFELIQGVIVKEEKSTTHTRRLFDKANQLIAKFTETVETVDGISCPLQLMIPLDDRKLFILKDKICVTDLNNKEIRTVDDIWEAVSKQLTISSLNQNLK